ncbi:MAG TPA: ThuA domain-containing protein [Pirellulales bacterium]
MIRPSFGWPLAFVALYVSLSSQGARAAEETKPKKVVFIAGTKSHGPGHHEYEQGLRLLAHCLETSPNLPKLKTEVHTDGWPKDEKTLDDADTIVLFSDGSDHDERDHPLLRAERLAKLSRLMKQGRGLVALHYTIFVPNEKGGQQFLDWIGGYFDYQSGPAANGWYSKIATHATRPRAGDEKHPICRGVTPFDLKEEYYYNLRFRADDKRLTPILVTDIPGEPQPQTVAYAVERADGGRGFGFSGGHFHSNWQVPNFRKLVLNAIVWSAGLEVPAGGVESTTLEEERAKADARPVRALLVTGDQHPAHLWRETSPPLVEALSALDPRFKVTVVEDPEALARLELKDYDLVVLNYCNWEKPGLSDAAKANFVKYLQAGGGLAIIHFSNGAFNFSLPKAEKSDWPEYRTKICRRVWDHTPGKSGHDAYGRFIVEVADPEHEITRGLKSFETADELYFRQQGEEPIHVLATAHSKAIDHDEPMAFVYEYGKGRVFQTVLGHDAAAIRNPPVAELIHRGATWVARREQRPIAERAAASPTPPEPLIPAPQIAAGRFGKPLDGAKQRAVAPRRDEYQSAPLSVECWARLRGKGSYNLLLANGPKESNQHWEIYTNVGDGRFHAYLPGAQPSIIDSGKPVVDDHWHFLAMTYDGQRVKLYVDGRLASDTKVAPAGGTAAAGPLFFASYPPGGLGCDGQLAEVRVSRAVRAFEAPPAGPLEVDRQTIGLWRFDAQGKDATDQADKGKAAAKIVVADLSSLKNNATLEAAAAPAPAVSDVIVPPAGKIDIAALDPALEVTLLDRSEHESFLGVKADTAGRLFVGGREALFVYEPDAKGGYSPRRELFRFPADSWLFDIEIRGDDLYVMTTSALYILPGARILREGIEAKRLIWGIPVDVHISYHSLAWGPEGDLYFCSGDPLLNYGDYNRADHWGHWTIYSQPAGTKTKYTGVGGVFRCRPDGSHFEVVAVGTRGCGGLAFDHDWNLFTNDNDHESLPQRYVPARLLHVAPGVDFAWPRGWMAEKSPDRADLLETMFTGMGREVPVGQTYYDEDYLPENYRHSLLVAEWGRLTLARYPLRPRGASFAADEHLLLQGRTHARPVGICVGRGGRLFGAVAYMAHNEGSPVYPSDLIMVSRKDDAPAHPFASYEATTAPADLLWSELGASSWWQRNRAHQEILRRGGDLLTEAATRLAKTAPTDFAAKHLVWLAAAGRSSEVGRQLRSLATDTVSPLQLQSLRALGEFVELGANDETFTRALASDSPQLQMVGLAAWARRAGELPPEVVAVGRSQDTYLRQTSTRLLARRLSVEQISRLCREQDSAARLAGVLAAGVRLTVPPASGPVPDSLSLNYTSGNAFFEIQYVGEKIDLRKLARAGSFTMAEWWKQVPHTPEQTQLFDLLKGLLTDPEAPVRLQAAYYLWLLADPATESLVAGVSTAADEARLAALPTQTIDKVWLSGPFHLREGKPAATPESGAIDLSAQYPSAAEPIGWQEAPAEKGIYALAAPDDAPAATYYAYCRLQSTVAQRARFVVTSGGAVKVWLNGSAIYENAVVAGGNKFANILLLELQPGSNDLLIRVQDLKQTSKQPVTVALAYSELPTVIATLPEKLGLGTLAERLKQGAGADAAKIPDEFLAVDWSQTAAAGDAARGRKLFGADALGCVKCHAIVPGQSGGGGPSLVDSGKRFTTAHLVESVLLPSKQIAPVFRGVRLATDDGLIFTGLVVNETAERLELMLPDATHKTIAKDDIEERTPVDVSPMPTGLVKTPAELRDLLAYLLSEKPLAP